LGIFSPIDGPLLGRFTEAAPIALRFPLVSGSFV
jgi:hypothetical protein